MSIIDGLSQFSRDSVGQDIARAMVSNISENLHRIRPTLHPYGFLIFRFPGEYSNHVLRCHVWLPEYRKRQIPDWPPHSHNSPLHSFVARGEVSHTEWDFFPSPRGKCEIYEVMYSSCKSILTKTGKRGEIKHRSDIRVAELSSYTVPKNVFHATEVPFGRDAVTIVLLSKLTEGASMVVGQHEAASRLEFDRSAVDRDRAVEAEQTVLAVIESRFVG